MTEDVIGIQQDIVPCKKIIGYFYGHQKCSDGSEKENDFTNTIIECEIDGQYKKPFFNINNNSRYTKDVGTYFIVDVSTPPITTGEYNRVMEDGNNSTTATGNVANKVDVSNNSIITGCKFSSNYKFVGGVGNVGRLAAGGIMKIYGVKA